MVATIYNKHCTTLFDGHCLAELASHGQMGRDVKLSTFPTLVTLTASLHVVVTPRSVGHSAMNDWRLFNFCSLCVDFMTEEGRKGGGRGDESEIMGVCTDRSE